MPLLLDAYAPLANANFRGSGNQLSEECLAENNWADLRRPYKDKYGRPSVTINRGRTSLVRGVQTPIREHVLIRDLPDHGIQITPTLNATSLRKEEWIELDRKILLAARYRLRAWKDLADANTFGGFNAMGKLVLETELMTDPGEAVVDMDGITEGRTDSPKFTGLGLPLPITHSDFFFSNRRLMASRNSTTPLDMTMGEAAGRRVAEMVEKTTIGVSTGIIYGGLNTALTYVNTPPQVYGYLNFPQRLTKTNLTTPTGLNPASTIADVLAMVDQLRAGKFYGPYMLYTSNDWDKWLDADYILTGGNVATQTLRERLKKITDIIDVRRLDMLFSSTTDANSHDIRNTTTYGPGGENIDVTLKPYTMILVQMTADVARAVDGMPITTVQWESKGGMQLNYKCLCIQVPQLRADAYGNCGICVGTTS